MKKRQDIYKKDRKRQEKDKLFLRKTSCRLGLCEKKTKRQNIYIKKLTNIDLNLVSLNIQIIMN